MNTNGVYTIIYNIIHINTKYNRGTRFVTLHYAKRNIIHFLKYITYIVFQISYKLRDFIQRPIVRNT